MPNRVRLSGPQDSITCAARVTQVGKLSWNDILVSRGSSKMLGNDFGLDLLVLKERWELERAPYGCLKAVSLHIRYIGAILFSGSTCDSLGSLRSVWSLKYSFRGEG